MRASFDYDYAWVLDPGVALGLGFLDSYLLSYLSMEFDPFLI